LGIKGKKDDVLMNGKTKKACPSDFDGRAFFIIANLDITID
jgi:hypothetical protein